MGLQTIGVQSRPVVDVQLLASHNCIIVKGWFRNNRVDTCPVADGIVSYFIFVYQSLEAACEWPKQLEFIGVVWPLRGQLSKYAL